MAFRLTKPLEQYAPYKKWRSIGIVHGVNLGYPPDTLRETAAFYDSYAEVASTTYQYATRKGLAEGLRLQANEATK